MTPEEIRTAARSLSNDDSRRIRAMNAVTDAETYVKRATELLAKAERVLGEPIEDGSRLWGGTVVNPD